MNGILSRLTLYLDLTKARLSALVVVTVGTGFLLASPDSIDLPLLGWTLLGTALAAAGANGLNQCVEVDRDARMDRTRERPLPSGRLARAEGLRVSIGLTLLGPAILVLAVNRWAAGLALLTTAIYILAYTPLKSRTPSCTAVGALCGAIPPLIGTVAASERIGAAGWILAALLFVWQMPHFFALAWLYRKDYERGGFRMLPVVDPSGNRTCRAVLLWSLALLAVGPAAAFFGVGGMTTLFGGLLLGGGMFAESLRLRVAKTDAAARRVFVGSLLYLPLLLTVLSVDGILRR